MVNITIRGVDIQNSDCAIIRDGAGHGSACHSPAGFGFLEREVITSRYVHIAAYLWGRHAILCKQRRIQYGGIHNGDVVKFCFCGTISVVADDSADEPGVYGAVQFLCRSVGVWVLDAGADSRSFRGRWVVQTLNGQFREGRKGCGGYPPAAAVAVGERGYVHHLRGGLVYHPAADGPDYPCCGECLSSGVLNPPHRAVLRGRAEHGQPHGNLRVVLRRAAVYVFQVAGLHRGKVEN
jgi:hypothetical protein